MASGSPAGRMVGLWLHLRRDGRRIDSADVHNQLELCRYMWWLRHVALTAALVVAGLDGEYERADRLAAVMLAVQLIGHACSRVWPPRAGLVAVADSACLLVLAGVGMAPFLVLVLAVAVLGSAATFRPVPAACSLAVVLVTVAVTYRLQAQDAAQLTVGQVLVAFTLLAGIFMTRTIRLNIAARASAEQERMVTERIDAIVWEELPGGGIKASAGAERVLGYPVAQWAEPGFWRSVVHIDDLDVASRLHAVDGSATFRVWHSDGSLRWVENRTTAVRDRKGRQVFGVGVLIDRTQQIESEKEAAWLLHAQARQDDLTALPNRRAFIETIERRLTSAPSEPAALLFLDLDHFKEINDSLGHPIGDALLCSLAERIVEAAGDSPVARLGGDEFGVLLPGSSAEEAELIGEQIAEVIKMPLLVRDVRLRVRTSVGIAVYPDDAADAAELVRRADIAMYQAKGQECETKRYDRSSDSFDAERVRLVADLDGAIVAGQLTLHHQPLLDLVTGAVVGSEALVRWNHPELGRVPPDRFIELAEVSGQIKQVTRWVIRTALGELAGLGPAGRALEASVNLSVRNLHESDLVDWLESTLAETGIDGSRLVVEITESTIMEDHESAVTMIGRLRDLGVRTWIDDFGTGHSSLARLRHLPVDAVKIDRAFVGEADRSGVDRDVLRGMIDLVHSLGLQTVAEGVERDAGLTVLRDLGCDLAQGFHIARPMPIGELSAWLTTAGHPLARVPAPRRTDRSARAG